MELWLGPLLELLGVTSLAASSRQRVPAPKISGVVASLSLFLAGAVLGAPAVILMPGIPSFLAIAIALFALLLVLLAAKLLGTELGCSSSMKASAWYAVAFYVGAYSALAVLLRS